MRWLIMLVALVGLVASALALREHYRTGASPCSINEKWDCGTVNKSPYAVIGGLFANTGPEVPGFQQGNQLHVFPGFLLTVGIVFTDFVRNRIVSGPMNQPLNSMRDGAFGRRGLAIMLRDSSRRAPQELNHGIIAQVEIPGATQVKHASQREHSPDRRLKCGQAQSQVPAGRVAGNAEPLQVEFGERVILMPI